MEITKDKFLKYNEILEREEKRGLRSYMTKVIANLSAGELSFGEVAEITKNYSTYEEEYGK